MLIVAFLCTDPNKKYVILLKAVNSNGNGPDIQTEVRTSDSKGKYSMISKNILVVSGLFFGLLIFNQQLNHEALLYFVLDISCYGLMNVDGQKVLQK